jgi:hypothetical protein
LEISAFHKEPERFFKASFLLDMDIVTLSIEMGKLFKQDEGFGKQTGR